MYSPLSDRKTLVFYIYGVSLLILFTLLYRKPNIGLHCVLSDELKFVIMRIKHVVSVAMFCRRKTGEMVRETRDGRSYSTHSVFKPAVQANEFFLCVCVTGSWLSE